MTIASLTNPTRHPTLDGFFLELSRTDARTSMGNGMRKGSQANASVHEVRDHMQAYGNVIAKRLKRCTQAV